MQRVAVALCVVLAAASAEATTVYYVATNAAGADNAACDGLSQTDQGAGHCPFKDLTSNTVRLKVQSASDVTMLFCGDGVVYDVGATAFIVQGAGSSFGTATRIGSCTGDLAVLDGGSVSRETVRISGSYVVVSGLKIQNAHDYNIEVRGADHVQITNNRVRHNVASDLVKGDGGASDVTVTGNDLTEWVSQAMDLAGTARWTISNNTMHGPLVAGQPCVGAKFESVDITISSNTMDGCYTGVSMGGVSSTHAGLYEAQNVVVELNQFSNLTGLMADAYSCVSCIFRNNSGWSALGGIRLSGAVTVQTVGGCNTGAGCVASSNFIASGNVMRSLNATPKNSFWVAEGTELSGLSAAANIYCLYPTDATARFGIDGVIQTFAGWQSATATDATSRVAATSETVCQPRFRFRSR